MKWRAAVVGEREGHDAVRELPIRQRGAEG
ncbi:uncharacterized protein SOCE836_060430 [Sorangium cellulosum]|uniref:Uncharacterized protein n=1 Tax=Sorangium cellulosum TaxID=56 RepID=A0A4P2QUS8_SORCE|nr:uncharacterized protein SOCE836_060430 [Sorangium cellulosum]WCQ93186.1 hypothetical protein NQZ70_05934 [Sorangium sp. Soce836]